LKDKANLEKYNRGLSNVGSKESDPLDLNRDDDVEIVSKKKQELRQKRAILTQFDKIATQFQSKKSDVGTDFAISTRAGTEKAETAGMIKKAARMKSKKEKTLGAKLRLKTKKGGSDSGKWWIRFLSI